MGETLGEGVRSYLESQPLGEPWLRSPRVLSREDGSCGSVLQLGGARGDPH